MKNNFIKKVAVTSLVALASISVFTGCTMNENQGNKIAIEQDATGGNGQKINEKEVKPGNTTKPDNKYAYSADGIYTGKTRIENGKVVEWAEEFEMDKTILPERYETVEGLSAPCHRIFYNVDGHEIKVNVNEKDGIRRFYQDGKTVGFAQIGKGVPDSNEKVFAQVAANRKLNDYIDENYRK